MLLQLAWKNVWRNKKRSFILFTAITIGLWCGLLACALFFGLWETTLNSAIDRELSHIQIHNPSYRDERDIKDNLSDPDKISFVLKNQSIVKNFSMRTIIEGMASSPTSASGVRIYGISPADEKKITSISTYVKEGKYLSQDQKNSVLIGRKLAEQLNLGLKKKIVLSFQGLDGNIIYAAFRITGIYETESTMFNAMNIFVNQSDLFDLLNSGSIYHEAVIKLNSSKEIPAALSILRRELPGYEIMDWGGIAPEYKLSTEAIDIELSIFLGLILFGLFFGITNTMLMSVIERIREIGILIAVGMKRYRVFLMIFTETTLLSLTGGVAGMILGAASTEILKTTGVNLSAFSEGLAAYGMASIVYPQLPFYYYPMLTLMIIVTALFGSVYPSIKAIRLNPAEAIRTY